MDAEFKFPTIPPKQKRREKVSVIYQCPENVLVFITF